MRLNEKEWFTEVFQDNTAFSVRHSQKLHEFQSKFQKIEVFQTSALGRVLSLDGCFMVTEKDSFVYHEMITHPTMAISTGAESVLVIGGGDGGTITELVKYPGLKSITLCEIDGAVVSTCKEFFPEISKGLADDRVKVVCLDGAAYLKQFTKEFDVILIDSTDPVGPGKALYELEFYQSVKKALKKGGAATFQTESPIMMSEVFGTTVRNLRSVFGDEKAQPYWCVIPSYPGAMWSFTICSVDKKDFTLPSPGLFQDFTENLQYYGSEIHHAAFVLPHFVHRLIA
ncbi:MAG: polyamine aminopropyltransferase [Pseudomonadota bacterium]